MFFATEEDRKQTLLTDVLAYVKTLDADGQKLYRLADDIQLITADTGSREFQLACAVLDVFWEQATEYRVIENL